MTTFRLDTKDEKADMCFLIEDCKVYNRPYYVVVDAETRKLLTKVNIPKVEAELNVDEDVIIVKNYSENEGLSKCLVEQGLIEPESVCSKELNIFCVAFGYRITDKFRDAIGKRWD